MTTIELRSLLTDNKKTVRISDEIYKVFNIWIKKRNYKVDLLEVFYAGYILSNPMVREKYLESDK